MGKQCWMNLTHSLIQLRYDVRFPRKSDTKIFVYRRAPFQVQTPTHSSRVRQRSCEKATIDSRSLQTKHIQEPTVLPPHPAEARISKEYRTTKPSQCLHLTLHKWSRLICMTMMTNKAAMNERHFVVPPAPACLHREWCLL